MKVTKAFADGYQVIEPSMYYAHPMETIYRIDIEPPSFLHMYGDGSVIFCSEKLNPILPTINLNDAYVGGTFSDYFQTMIASPDCDLCMHEYFKIIINNSILPPVIIGGCGRSGTTLLLSILDAHPLLMSIHREMYSFYPEPFRFRQLAHEVEKACGRRWVEKTPKNIYSFRKIYDMFEENVKLIHIVRDGRDVITSVHPGHKGKFWVNEDRWIDDVSEGLKNDKISLTVKYEDIVSDPKNTLKKICEYIDINFDISMLDFSHNTSKKNDIALNGVIQPLSTRNIGRWSHPDYAKRIKQFMLNEKAVRILKELNYV